MTRLGSDLDTSRPVGRRAVRTTPAGWLEAALPRLFEANTDPGLATDSPRMTGVRDLLADDGAMLRALRERLLHDGSSEAGASTAVASAFGGLAAMAVGYAFVMTGAGFLVTEDSLRWTVREEGWADGIHLGASHAVVAGRHVWNDHPDVRPVAGEGAAGSLAVAALVEVIRPLIETTTGFGRVGRVGLWNEVGDGFAAALTYGPDGPTTSRMRRLRILLDVEDVPWKGRAEVAAGDMPGGSFCVLRKGGCCLAFTAVSTNVEEPDEDRRAYLARFPQASTAPDLCITCRRRTFDDCAARQRWWRDRLQG